MGQKSAAKTAWAQNVVRLFHIATMHVIYLDPGIPQMELGDVLRERGWAPGTADIDTIRKILRTLRSYGYIYDLPFEGLRRGSGSVVPRGYFLTPKGVEALQKYFKRLTGSELP